MDKQITITLNPWVGRVLEKFAKHKGLTIEQVAERLLEASIRETLVSAITKVVGKEAGLTIDE